MPGPVKQPKAMAKLKGNDRPGRYPDDMAVLGAVSFITVVPPHPEILNSDGQGIWYGILEDALRIPDYISVGDLPIFTQLCYNFQLMTQAQRVLNEADPVMTDVSTTGSTIKVSPWFSVYQESSRMFHKLCREFGLSPSSRTGIKLMKQGEKEKDPLAEFTI